MTAIAITGHRNVTSDDIKTIRLTMTTVLSDASITDIYFGGARGADTEALRACLDLRTGTSPRLIVVVPDEVEQQPRAAREWISKADAVIELENAITPKNHYRAYDIRNEFLVEAAREKSGIIVAFWNGKPSGTANCIKYAKAASVPVQVVRVTGGLDLRY